MLKAEEPLSYQLGFLASELVEIFSKAPAPPSVSSSSASAADAESRRKPIEEDAECAIFATELNAEREAVVFCAASCGNNLHGQCFEKWAATKKASAADGVVTCPFCRAPWASDESGLKTAIRQGKTNADGYVNVASELGLSGRRGSYYLFQPFSLQHANCPSAPDDSTYHSSWARSRWR